VQKSLKKTSFGIQKMKITQFLPFLNLYFATYLSGEVWNPAVGGGGGESGCRVCHVRSPSGQVRVCGR